MRERRRHPRHATQKIGRLSPAQPKLGKVAGWLGAAIVLALVGTQGTYALWTTSVSTTSGQQVQAADFLVAVSNSAGSNVQMPMDLNLSQGVTPVALFPGQSQFNEATFFNRSTARPEAAVSTVRLKTKPYAVDSAAPANRNFAGSLSLQVAVNVPVATACSAATGYLNVAMGTSTAGGEALSDGPSATVAKNGSTKWCFQTTLASNAPNSAQGRSAVINVAVNADQVPVR